MVCVLELVLTVAAKASQSLKLFCFTIGASEGPLRKTKLCQSKHRTGPFDDVNLSCDITLREYAVKELEIDLGISLLLSN